MGNQSKEEKKIAAYFISCSCKLEAPRGANQTIPAHIVEHRVDIEGNWALAPPHPNKPDPFPAVEERGSSGEEMSGSLR